MCIVERSFQALEIDTKTRMVRIGLHRGPHEIWYLDKNGDELYESDNGIFVAHSRFEEDLYEKYGTIKVPPKDVVVVEVEISDDVIHVKNPESIQKWTWTKVTKPEEMEELLMRRNKRHLQQMYIEQSPPTTAEFEPFLAHL
eukprot:scaffold76836_cov71-Cyclotella_meneghiniana.AAC.3